ncbi:MAG: hypothetical protein QM811_25890 [Pirellulales bacterium]
MPAELPPTSAWSDDTVVTDYRTWNVAALLTGACGLLSPVAIFAPALLFLPFLTFGIALIAWRMHVAQPDRWLGADRVVRRRVGRGDARLRGPREWSWRRWVFDGARQTSEQWLTFTRDGHPMSAFDLTRPPLRRFFSAAALEKYLESDEKGKEALDKYVVLPDRGTLEPRACVALLDVRASGLGLGKSRLSNHSLCLCRHI